MSGIVGGRALRGPADKMLLSLGEESSALGVARRYVTAGLLDGLAIDTQDERLADAITNLGLETLIGDTIMGDRQSRATLASVVLEFAVSIAAARQSEAGAR